MKKIKQSPRITQWLQSVTTSKALPPYVNIHDWNSDDYGNMDLRVMCAPCGRQV